MEAANGKVEIALRQLTEVLIAEKGGKSVMSEKETGFNEGLEYAAKWIIDSARCIPDEPRTTEFASNMAMSLRASKKPWTVFNDPATLCKVCGKQVDIYPPDQRGTCYDHCEDHNFQTVDRETRCEHCNMPAPDDWYDED